MFWLISCFIMCLKHLISLCSRLRSALCPNCVFSQCPFFRPTQSLSPASVMWCAVRSAPVYTNRRRKQRRYEWPGGFPDSAVWESCSDYSAGSPPSDSCSFSSARRSVQRPSERGKTARWPSKETSWGISSHRLLLKTPGNSTYSCILFS